MACGLADTVAAALGTGGETLERGALLDVDGLDLQLVDVGAVVVLGVGDGRGQRLADGGEHTQRQDVDLEEAEIVERSDGTWLVDGQYNFYDFLEYFDMEDLYAEHDYNTLSGLILEILERVPKTGEKLSWLNFEFEIVDMDGARIDKVLVSKIPQKE